MPNTSRRSQQTPLSPFRALIPVADAAKAAGAHVYHLNIGQPDIVTPPEAWRAVREDQQTVLAYSPAGGILPYREGLVDYYRRFDIELSTANVLVTTGASEALLFTMLCCLDEGDEIIIPEPFYANYNGFAHIANVKIRPVTCRLEDGFALPNVADFAAQITPRTRAIMITNPNNPTGCCYTLEDLTALAALAKKHDLFFLADEVYREFCYDGNTFHSILNLPDVAEQAIVFDSISKRYSACGARVGALVTRNEAVLEAVLRYAKLRLSPPGLGQLLALGALQNDMAYLQECVEEYDRRRQVVYEGLRAIPGVKCYLPGGAFYCFAEFPIDDADRFCRWLLEEFRHEGATVMLSPGQGFYATPELGRQQVRIAYVLNTEDLTKAIHCLSIAVATYPGRTPDLSNFSLALSAK